jgi:hypothetical protein
VNAIAITLAAILATGGVVCLYRASQQVWELQLELNDQLPREQKFEPHVWTPLTYLRLRRLQKKVLPKSPRPKRMLVLVVSGCQLLLSAAVILAKAKFF